MIKFARPGMRGRRGFHTLHQLLNRGSLPQKSQLVGIGHPKIYGVFGLKLVSENFLAIDESPVAAAHVFQHHSAVHGNDLCLLTADAAVAKGQLVARLAADSKRRGANRHFTVGAIRFNYNESRYTWHRFGLAQPNPERIAPRRNWQTWHMVGKAGAEVNSRRCVCSQHIVNCEAAWQASMN